MRAVISLLRKGTPRRLLFNIGWRGFNCVDRGPVRGSPPRRGVRTQPGVLTPGNVFQTVHSESGAGTSNPEMEMVRFTPCASDPGAPTGQRALIRLIPELKPRAEPSSPSGGGIRSLLKLCPSGSCQTTVEVRGRRQPVRWGVRQDYGRCAGATAEARGRLKLLGSGTAGNR